MYVYYEDNCIKECQKQEEITYYFFGVKRPLHITLSVRLSIHASFRLSLIGALVLRE